MAGVRGARRMPYLLGPAQCRTHPPVFWRRNDRLAEDGCQLDPNCRNSAYAGLPYHERSGSPIAAMECIALPNDSRRVSGKQVANAAAAADDTCADFHRAVCLVVSYHWRVCLP